MIVCLTCYPTAMAFCFLEELRWEFTCYLYVFYGSARKLKMFAALSLLCLRNIYLYGPQNSWQVLFHIGVASLSSYQILARKPMEKQTDSGV
nr:PREDICTED: vesicle-trafficking protein SEC22c-like [Latimeria chalumnae]|eukprot:XP_014339887.1 PREDICTED: vesicle-trafficking protein SEC22c-like [Latimeria chalumnae]